MYIKAKVNKLDYQLSSNQLYDFNPALLSELGVIFRIFCHNVVTI